MSVAGGARVTCEARQPTVCHPKTEKRKIFIGRENNLAAIDQYLVDRTGRPLVLHGRSGFGKSALMARAVANAETAGSAPVIYRFVGATAPSSDIRSLLISLGIFTPLKS